jgi:hypothetical protein
MYGISSQGGPKKKDWPPEGGAGRERLEMRKNVQRVVRGTSYMQNGYEF